MRTAVNVKERENTAVGVALGLTVLPLVVLFLLLFFFILLSLLHAYLLFLSFHHHTSCSLVRKVEK